MGRITTTLSGIERTLLNRLADANTAATASAVRAASASRINAAKDDPTGFVQLGGLQTELTRVRASLVNVSAASTLVAGAQLALDQIRSQLDVIREAALEDADESLSSDERAENQAAIDDALTAIRALVRTSTQGQRLFDGSADYQYSGINHSQIRALWVYDKGPAASPTISGQVTSAATQGSVTASEPTGAITGGDVTFAIVGSRGSATIEASDGEALTSVRDKINAETHNTGITATLVGGVDMVLTTLDYGSRATATLNMLSGASAGESMSGSGTDAVATINGRAYTGDGNRFTAGENGLRFSLEFASGFSGAFSTVTVSGNAPQFALLPDDVSRQVLSIPGLQPELLGGLSGNLADLATAGQYAGLGTNASRAVRIVDEAIGQLTRVQGRVDGFATAAIDSSQSLLESWESNLATAITDVNGVSGSEENSLQALYAAMAQNAVSGLSILNSQRSSLVSLVQQIAGL